MCIQPDTIYFSRTKFAGVVQPISKCWGEMTEGAKMKMWKTLLKIALVLIVALSTSACLSDGGGYATTETRLEEFAEEQMVAEVPAEDHMALSLIWYCQYLNFLSSDPHQPAETSGLCDCLDGNVGDLDVARECTEESEDDIRDFCSSVDVPSSAEEVLELASTTTMVSSDPEMDGISRSEAREIKDIVFCYNVSNEWDEDYIVY